MSKRKQQFLDQMGPLGFNADDLAIIYEQFMKIGMRGHTLRQVIPFEEGRMFYDLDFRRLDDKVLRCYGFHANLRSVLPIAHGSFVGVNTRLLEEQLLEIDWTKRLPVSGPLLDKAQQALHRIWKDMEKVIAGYGKEATDIIQLLQVKYWAGTWAEQYVYLDLMTVRYDRPYNFDLKNTYKDVSARAAYNLLCGRPVLRDSPDNDPHWFQLKRITVCNPHRYFDEHKYAVFDLEAAIERLQVRGLTFDTDTRQVYERMARGERIYATTHPAKQVLSLQVDPDAQAVQITKQPIIKAKNALINQTVLKRKRGNGL